MPNIAHASIKAHLLNNNFEYTSSGILDETHLRFFTSNFAIKLVSDAGLEIADCKLTNAKDIYGWQKSNPYSKLPESIIKYILKDKQSSIMQFVFKCKLSDKQNLYSCNMLRFLEELDKMEYMPKVNEYLKT